jgi:hypothetical protein
MSEMRKPSLFLVEMVAQVLIICEEEGSKALDLKSMQ